MNYYNIISPSLEGVIRHDSLIYDGIVRPPELSRIFDKPVGDVSYDYSTNKITKKERIILEQYFHDLYAIYIKKLSYYIMSSDINSGEELKLVAMLQEMIKIKKLL